MIKPNIEYDKISKFLSYVLRHCPEDINLNLDPNGWASISELIDKAKPKITLTENIIKAVAFSNNKQRFAISNDGLCIRANQGHSLNINLGLSPTKPPTILYHGTATRFLDSINKNGLQPGKRNHVHLSTDIETAKAVGKRHGKPAVLKIAADDMHQQQFKFFLSDNNVWLTDYVPPKFLSLA